MSGLFQNFGSKRSIQQPFDVAVVMPTIVRPSLGRALASILNQNFAGRIQVLIGVDKPLTPLEPFIKALGKLPPRRVVSLFDPGYSTSVRHGGLHPARDGGALRSVLTYLANARHVAYLDDDNWWDLDHLNHMSRAIEGKAWAYSYRCFTHPLTARPITIDRWESVGPGRGIHARQFGGWVDPNCLMIDKLACEPAIRRWSLPLAIDPSGLSADRNVFHALKRYPSGGTRVVTVYYQLKEKDALHPARMKRFGPAFQQAGNLDMPPPALEPIKIREQARSIRAK